MWRLGSGGWILEAAEEVIGGDDIEVARVLDLLGYCSTSLSWLSKTRAQSRCASVYSRRSASTRGNASTRRARSMRPANGVLVSQTFDGRPTTGNAPRVARSRPDTGTGSCRCPRAPEPPAWLYRPASRSRRVGPVHVGCVTDRNTHRLGARSRAIGPVRQYSRATSGRMMRTRIGLFRMISPY